VARYLRKSIWVEARQFVTNNDSNNEQIDSIIKWLIDHGTDARHDGTSIYIEDKNGDWIEVSVGEWLIFDHNGKLQAPIKNIVFSCEFEKCDHYWEPVEDTNDEQCVDCREIRAYKPEYFDDDVL
jgi:hypothetical protein